MKSHGHYHKLGFERPWWRKCLQWQLCCNSWEVICWVMQLVLKVGGTFVSSLLELKGEDIYESLWNTSWKYEVTANKHFFNFSSLSEATQFDTALIMLILHIRTLLLTSKLPFQRKYTKLIFTSWPETVLSCETGPGISDHNHILNSQVKLKTAQNKKQPREIQRPQMATDESDLKNIRNKILCWETKGAPGQPLTGSTPSMSSRNLSPLMDDWKE